MIPRRDVRVVERLKMNWEPSKHQDMKVTPKRHKLFRLVFCSYSYLRLDSLSDSPGVETLLMHLTSCPRASIAKTLAVSLLKTKRRVILKTRSEYNFVSSTMKFRWFSQSRSVKSNSGRNSYNHTFLSHHFLNTSYQNYFSCTTLYVQNHVGPRKR